MGQARLRLQFSGHHPFTFSGKVELQLLGALMALSSVGRSTISALNAGHPRPARTEIAQKMMKNMDTDQNGSVSKMEFLASSDKMKAEVPTAQGAQAPNPPSGANAPRRPSAEQLFASADQNGDQSLSVDELSSMLAAGEARAKAAESGNHRGTGTSGGAPPPGGGGPPGGRAAAGGSTSTSSGSEGASTSASSSTDPADTNKDGVVSAAEKLLYELTHASSSSTKGSSSTNQTTTLVG